MYIDISKSSSMYIHKCIVHVIQVEVQIPDTIFIAK